MFINKNIIKLHTILFPKITRLYILNWREEKGLFFFQVKYQKYQKESEEIISYN